MLHMNEDKVLTNTHITACTCSTAVSISPADAVEYLGY